MKAVQPMELPGHELLAQLARDDPAAYEALRRELIDSFIASAPERVRPRLRGIQFRVDHVRQMSRSTLGSTVKIYELMWESFLRLNASWQSLASREQASDAGTASGPSAVPASRPGARVLEFGPRPAAAP